MFRRILFLSPLLILSAAAQIPAFPGAQGFGAYAKGGRGGDVYFVTNLNNNGAGSLRVGLNTVPAAGRTIVFAVSGYIPVVSDTNFNVPANVTIAGQTAPGDGVGLRGGRMLISGSNVVMRHFRIRHGKNGTGGDCLNIDGSALNTMLDHLSLMFSTDENFSFFKSSVNDFTMQYSNSTWGMERHNAGGLWDLQNGSCHHTLWAHHRTRNPKARPGTLEWINNVTFHWRNEGFIMGDSETPASWKANVRGCYYISIDDADDGSVIKSSGLTKATVASNGVPNFSLYLNDTFFDDNDDKVLNGTDRGYTIVAGSEFKPGDAVGSNRYYKSATPFAGASGLATVVVDDAKTGYKKVLSSGAPLRLDANYSGKLRDELDTLLVDSVVKQYSILVQKDGKVAGEDPARTSNGEQLLADQYGITNNGFGTLNGTTPPTDSDLDGMPDFWEFSLNGKNGMAFNAAADDHNAAFSAGQLANTFFPAGTPVGYTYLEEYLHFLAVPHATVSRNTTEAPSVQVIDLRKYTDGFTASPQFTLAGALQGSTRQFLADGITPSATGPIVKFTPTPNATGRAGFNFTVVDTEGSQWTQQFAILVSPAAASRDLSWSGDGATNAWNDTAPNWQTGSGVATTFGMGDTALFDERGSSSPAIQISGNQIPGSVLVTGTKNYTFGGGGSIGSTGALTKAGDTSLTLAANMSFAQGTFLNGGETILGPAGTLGGGPIRFTGGSTLTSQHTDQSSNTLSLLPDLRVDSGAVGNINLSQRVNVKGSLSGGGVFNIFSPSNLGIEGRVYLDGASAACTGTVNLSGGATVPGNGGRIAFRANGGSFNGFESARVNLTGVDVFNTNSGSGNTYALGELSGDAYSRLRGGYVGGATTWSVGGLGTSSVFAGVMMDGNSQVNLTKTGAGTLTMGGANTYSGTTTVSAGTLQLSGSLAATAVTVASGARFSGAGTVAGSLALASGATVDPGATPGEIGTLTLGSGMTLSSGSTLSYDLSGNPNGANDRISVTGGTLSQNGTMNFVFNKTDGYLSAGTYQLVTDAPNSSAASTTFTHNFPDKTRQSFEIKRSSTGASGAKSIWLEVGGAAGNLTWTGSTSTWNIDGTAPWSNGAGDINKFYNLDVVTFDDRATNRTATLALAMEPAAVVVNNSGAGYFFDGPGSLAGKTTLTKRGPGTLTISNTATNLHTGSTLIEGGTVALGNATGLLGSGDIQLKGGALALPGSSTFLSNSMVVSANSAISSANPGNSTILNSTSNTLTSVGEPILSLAGVSGILSINGAMDGFSGTLSFGIGNGMLRLNSNSSGAADVNSGSAAAHFDLGSGGATLTNRNGGRTIRLGALSGGPSTHLNGRQSGSDATSTTYVIGEKNLSTVFSGAISNAGDLGGVTLVKSGTGTLSLNGTSSFIGDIAVVQGALLMGGSTVVSRGTTVDAGASLVLAGGLLGTDSLVVEGTLGGAGTIAADVVAKGRVVGTGFAGPTTGILRVSGDFSLDGGVMKLRGGVQSDLVQVTGELELQGSLTVLLSSGTTFGRYPLLTYGGILADGQLDLTGIPPGTVAQLSNSVAGRIDLVIDDSDEDGLPDSWEKHHFGNTGYGPNDDPDGDGQSNVMEHLAGTLPNDGSSRFAATLTPLNEAQFVLSWPSVPGRNYQVQTNRNLAEGWGLLTTVAGAASPATITQLTVTKGGGKTFYRIALSL